MPAANSWGISLFAFFIIIIYTPIPHCWSNLSLSSPWHTLSCVESPFCTNLRLRALQLVCIWQAALDDVSLEKYPSGHLSQMVSLSGVPAEKERDYFLKKISIILFIARISHSTMATTPRIEMKKNMIFFERGKAVIPHNLVD